MHYFSQRDIQDIVTQVIAQSGLCSSPSPGKEIPVEISARHVHLDQASMEILFGPGAALTHKRDLSQPGQFLAQERVKLVTPRGQLDNVAILGPIRPENQVELSLTDARILGVSPPIRLSGDLTGAGDVLIIGPKGVVEARGSAIVAKAHVHMTPSDARAYNVEDGEHVDIRLGSQRPVTLNDVIVRVSPGFALAVHIDFDEANAAQVKGDNIIGILQKSR